MSLAVCIASVVCAFGKICFRPIRLEKISRSEFLTKRSRHNFSRIARLFPIPQKKHPLQERTSYRDDLNRRRNASLGSERSRDRPDRCDVRSLSTGDATVLLRRHGTSHIRSASRLNVSPARLRFAILWHCKTIRLSFPCRALHLSRPLESARMMAPRMALEPQSDDEKHECSDYFSS